MNENALAWLKFARDDLNAIVELIRNPDLTNNEAKDFYLLACAIYEKAQRALSNGAG